MSEHTPYTDPNPETGYDGSVGTPAAEPAPIAEPAQVKERGVSVGQILAGILFVLVVIFIAENSDSVAIRIIAGPKVHAPVFVWLLAAAVLGALIAGLMRVRRRQHAKIRARAKANS